MPAFAIVLLAVTGVILLITLLLCCKVRITLRYDDGFAVQVRYLFLRFRVYPQALKLQRPKKEKEKKDKVPPPKEKEEKQAKKSGGVKEILSLITETLRRLGRRYFRRFSLHIRTLDVRVCAGDAATTAILTGACNAGVVALCGVAEGFFTRVVKKGDCIRVIPDFAGEGSQIRAEMVLAAAPRALLAALFCILRVKLSGSKRQKRGAVRPLPPQKPLSPTAGQAQQKEQSAPVNAHHT